MKKNCSKEVKTNETASFIFLQEDIIGEDGIDDIKDSGSKLLVCDDEKLSEIKISVS